MSRAYNSDNNSGNEADSDGESTSSVARSVGTRGSPFVDTNSPQRPPLIPEPTNPYPDMKEEFERTHTKVGFEYVRETCKDGCRVVVRYPEDKFNKLYRERRCMTMVKNKKGELEEVQVSFIRKWMDDPNIRKYDEVGIYPDPEGLRSPDNKCPVGVYSLWTSFRAKSIDPIPISDSNQAERTHNLASIL